MAGMRKNNFWAAFSISTNNILAIARSKGECKMEIECSTGESWGKLKNQIKIVKVKVTPLDL